VTAGPQRPAAVAAGPQRPGAVTAGPTCPFCESPAVERVGLWGGQIVTAQWRCRECSSYFEAIRADFEDECHETPT
jgi:hypothetical protein